MINSNSNFKSIYAKFKKIINRIFLFILAMPMGIPILLPFFILYAIYLSLSNKEKPNICFIPTATGDNDSYKVNYYDVFTKFNCNPTHIDFFKRTIDLSSHIPEQDIIFVGGGNTKSMLAVWKDWGLDVLLRDAYENGTVMSGVSAGAICWFEKGITDSWAHDLAVMDCLGFVNGICCPHYDEEPARRPFVEKVLKDNLIDHCLSVRR